jgi:hypothetical protein
MLLQRGIMLEATYSCALPGLRPLQNHLQRRTMTLKKSLSSRTRHLLGVYKSVLLSATWKARSVGNSSHRASLTTTNLWQCKGGYDELLWIPGAFQNPWSGEQTYRATRAYVSTGVSLYNGLCP